MRVGPCQRIARKVGDWTIIAEEVPQTSGDVRWDVRAEHGNTRVPLGMNLHAEPGAELERLKRLVLS